MRFLILGQSLGLCGCRCRLLETLFNLPDLPLVYGWQPVLGGIRITFGIWSLLQVWTAVLG